MFLFLFYKWTVNSQHAELFERLPNIYSHFEPYIGFGLTLVDEINSRTAILVVCPTQPIPCLLMPQ